MLAMAKLNETLEPVNVADELGLLVFAIEALCGELGPVLVRLFSLSRLTEIAMVDISLNILFAVSHI